MLFIIAIGAFLATFLGGLFALKFKDKLHLILGFSAGAVIGVAFFDLIPEALELGLKSYDIPFIISISALGFIIYMILDRTIFFHCHGTEDESLEEHRENIVLENDPGKRGILGAGSLSLHSFIDGIAVGLAFQVSLSIGLVVAIAVLVHDFSDGINTVNMILKNGGGKSQAFKWLFADALAPVLGIISTLFFTLPEKSLAIILAFFAGFFLYIGASDLLPESHHEHPTIWTTFVTILGVIVLFLAIKLAGI